jgi:hypothetical protein
VNLEKLDEVRLLRFTDTLELKDLLEVRFRLVSDMNKVSLNQAFGRGRPNL